MEEVQNENQETERAAETAGMETEQIHEVKVEPADSEPAQPEYLQIGAIKIDATLLELLAGIIVWGIVCQLAGVWFVSDKSGYSRGIWLGVLIAFVSGLHMWWGLNKALDFSQPSAMKLMIKYNMIRYLLIVLAMGVIMISGFANPLSAFLSLIGLKVSAYLQPFTHKVCAGIYKKGGAS